VTKANLRCACGAWNKNFPMNKFERQSRDPAGHQALTEAIEAELPEIPGQVMAISDAPPIAPRAPLTPAETRNKRQALRRFTTQMHVMDWFLDGFARSNEVFSRPKPFKAILPSRRSPCCDQ